MNFNKVFLETWDSIGDLSRKIAAEASSCPDSPKELWVSGEFLLTAKDALALLCVVPLCIPSSRNYFLIQNLRNHVARMASNYRLEGDWFLVGQLLKQDTGLQIYVIWKTVLGSMTLQDWFGNFVPRLRKAIRSLRWRTMYSSVVADPRPVRWPQRKRGYDDKGSWRLSHERIPKEAWVRLENKLTKVTPREPAPFAWFWLWRVEGSG
jgi:hypothetical protein